MNALDLPGPGVLHSGYGAEMGAFDELLGPDGAPRAHWARLLHASGSWVLKIWSSVAGTRDGSFGKTA